MFESIEFMVKVLLTSVVSHLWIAAILAAIAWFMRGAFAPTPMATFRERANYEVPLEQFRFDTNNNLIFGVLSGNIASGSLDEEQSERLDEQLVWAFHRDNDVAREKTPKDWSAQTLAYLKEAWLWERCSLAMHHDSFYKRKAHNVAYNRCAEVRRLVAIHGESIAPVVGEFAEQNYGSILYIDAYDAISRAYADVADSLAGRPFYDGEKRNLLTYAERRRVKQLRALSLQAIRRERPLAV